VDVDEDLAELVPPPDVARVGAQRNVVCPLRSVIHSASRAANRAAVTKNARVSCARRRSLFAEPSATRLQDLQPD
jgi:hypothetical protein